MFCPRGFLNQIELYFNVAFQNSLISESLLSTPFLLTPRRDSLLPRGGGVGGLGGWVANVFGELYAGIQR
jgi:hypothetical protein